MSQGFEDMERENVTVSAQEVQPQEVQSATVTATPITVEVEKPLPDLEELCKGHGRIEVMGGGKVLLGHRGHVAVAAPTQLLVVAKDANNAKTIREGLQGVDGVVVVDDFHTLVPLSIFGKVKKLIRMKRNISEAGREKRRTRMREYWAKKSAEKAGETPVIISGPPEEVPLEKENDSTPVSE